MHRRVALPNVRFWLSFASNSGFHHSSHRKIHFRTSPGELPQLESVRFWLDQGHSRVEDSETCFHLLQACGKLKALLEGRQVHAVVSSRELERDTSVANQIIIMYGKCASLEDVRRSFDQMHQRNVVSWTAMMGADLQYGHYKEVFCLFQKMQMEGVNPNMVTFITVLKACNDPEALVECSMIHALIVRYGFESDVSVGNSLVTSYVKCGSIMDAQLVFETMKDRNVISWTAMIGAFAQSGNCNNALKYFRQMYVEGVKTNMVSFIAMLNACTTQMVLLEGKIIHAVIGWSEVELDVVLGSALVHMYGKCGRTKDARRMFFNMPQRNVITYNAMIAIFVQHGSWKEALQLFEQMQCDGVKPDKVSFMTLLNPCASPADLTRGKMIHVHCIEAGLELNEVVGCALINMYGKCGSVVDAQSIFDKLQKRNVVSWSSLIATHAKIGHMNEATQLFRQMEQEGEKPNEVTFVSLLSSFDGPASLMNGVMIHVQVIESGFVSDLTVGSALVSMYGKCGELEAAWRMFKSMHQRNVVTWNAMIAAYVQHGHSDDAFKLFQVMQLEGVKLSEISFVSLLSACVGSTLLAQGKMIHALIVETGSDSDVVVGTALVNMYGKCGSVEDAYQIFDSMDERNLTTWNGIIATYALYRRSEKVWENFQQMRLKGVKPNEITFISMLSACASPEALQDGKVVHALIIQMGLEIDVVVGNALVNMYGKCGSLTDAWRTFNNILQRNVASWSAMIGVFATNMHGSEAFQVFLQMQQRGIELDKVSLINVLSVCTSLSALSEGKMIHNCAITQRLEADVMVGTALVSMYGRCGPVKDAQRVFDKIHQRDVVAWTALISAYAQHGHTKEALHLFHWMQTEGVKPNQISFVSILSACSHSGLVDEGCWLFVSMSQVYGLTPAAMHYGCMIDLLGRSGRLDEAENVINNMPMQPGIVEWMTLLGACRAHGDEIQGNRIVDCIMDMDREYVSVCMVLSDTHATAFQCGDFLCLKRVMSEEDVKQLGYSSMETNDQVLAFCEVDRCHPNCNETYSECGDLVSNSITCALPT